MKRTLFAILLLYCVQTVPFIAKAQEYEPTRLSIVPTFGNRPLVLDKDQYTLGKDSLRISTFRFYISGIVLFQDTVSVWVEPKSYHLVDITEPLSMDISLRVPSDIHFNKVAFNLGIDSVTNASGAGGGELDATRGMYWAWQSGYINMKIEGNSPLCNTRKHQFQYHLGGFREADYCLQKIELPIPDNRKIKLGVDVSFFLKGINLKEQPEVMTPGPQAVMLSRKAASMFYMIQPGR